MRTLLLNVAALVVGVLLFILTTAIFTSWVVLTVRRQLPDWVYIAFWFPICVAAAVAVVAEIRRWHKPVHENTLPIGVGKHDVLG